MDRRVTVEELTHRQDTMGGEVEVWTRAFVCPAEVQWLAASERFASQQDLAEETVKFRIRYRSDFLPSAKRHRIKYRPTLNNEERVYNVTGIAELGRREGWELTCAAGVE